MRENANGWIEQEMQGASYGPLLAGLRRQHPAFRPFKAWTEVVPRLQDRSTDGPARDRLLRPLLRANRGSADKRIQTILLAVFWPGLVSIHRQKRSWDSNPEELWQNILCTFFEVTQRIDVTKRRERYLQKIYNDTVHRLHDRYRKLWNARNHEHAVPQEDLDASVGAVGIDTDSIDFRETQRKKVERYRCCLHEGWINLEGFRLLVETRVYGKSMVAYARDWQISYEATKKRRQRAEAAIRRGEGQ